MRLVTKYEFNISYSEFITDKYIFNVDGFVSNNADELDMLIKDKRNVYFEVENYGSVPEDHNRVSMFMEHVFCSLWNTGLNIKVKNRKLKNININTNYTFTSNGVVVDVIDVDTSEVVCYLFVKSFNLTHTYK